MSICVNYFNLHSRKRGCTRRVTERLVALCPEITNIGDKICDQCIKYIYRQTQGDSENIEVETEVSTKKTSIIKPLNELLKALGKKPISSVHYSIAGLPISIIDDLCSDLKHILIDNYKEPKDFELEVVNDLSIKFHDLNSFKDKVHLLTILPNSWSAEKLVNTFNCSYNTAEQAKIIRREFGILSYPEEKCKRPFSDEILSTVTDFYKSDEVSRVMPGAKDSICVKKGEEKVHIQKRLVLNNLKELYTYFKEKNPSVTLGFSKFAELRPKECILAGANGTHSVCVCLIHQNVKLMICGAKLAKLAKDIPNFPITYKCMLSEIMCTRPTTDCHLQMCENCPGFNCLKQKLEFLFAETNIESLTFNEWTTTDRAMMQSREYKTEEYIATLEKRLILLQKHDFIARSQNGFLEDTKHNLKSQEFVVLGDFSENYSFVIQDEIQSYHWSTNQATIHPFVVYYKCEETLKHLSFVMISENLQHNTTAVHLFQTKLIDYLKTKFSGNINKISYFSDGAASQYKNKYNFVNIAYHKEDFGFDAEWHFFATSHGKSACDGIGGTVKRLAARASLQKTQNHEILTPRKLFEWAKESIHNVHFEYCSNEEHETHEKLLQGRFTEAKTVKGTRSFHAFYPVDSKTRLHAKIYSNAENFESVRIT